MTYRVTIHGKRGTHRGGCVQSHMPGYRDVPSRFVGPVAAATRAAQEAEGARDTNAAVALYEDAVRLSLIDGGAVPGYLCGRLASLYRRLGRLEDEILLLERYAAGQVADTLVNRYVTRLAKARALASRRVTRDSGALASVRAIRSTPRAGRKRQHARDEIQIDDGMRCVDVD